MLRDEDEIVRAHDLLVGILLGEVDVDASEEQREQMNHAATALCWVLRHDHNPTFANYLKEVEAATEAAGYRLRPVN